jgi:S1-C subfamily serine protease
VKAIYYDPIHDFGFLKFDPKAVRRTTITELKLRPDLAVLGMEIRVIGNDAAQKLTISGGTISRLNRNAPSYVGYRDFNTNYIQGSAMTSGGSSGSPVIDIDGYVVALNAGSFTNASIALFLPLEQPVRALEHILRGELVARGTLEIQWTLQPFHECQPLGLTDAWIAKVLGQAPEENSMLVAKSVLPGGPAESKIVEGDVLLKVNDMVVTRFNELTDILDSNVSSTIDVTIQRGNDEIKVEVKVEDLHAITPHQYFVIAGSLFHNFSYIQAQQYRLPVRESGVFLCAAQGSFDFGPGGHLIQSVDGKPTNDLDALKEVLQSIPGEIRLLHIDVLSLKLIQDRKLIRVSYKSLYDVNKVEHDIVELNRSFCSTEFATRDSTSGLWVNTDIPDPPSHVSSSQQKVAISSTKHPKYPNASYIVNSIAWVTVYLPRCVDGFLSGPRRNYGLIVNEELGLVLVSRDAIPHGFCSCTITICGSVLLPGELIFTHPVQNFAVLRYDASKVQAPLQRARLSAEEIQPGDEALFFRCYGGQIELKPAFIAGLSTVYCSPQIAPGTRSVNFEALAVDTNSTSYKSGCGLISEDGTVQALWLGECCLSTTIVLPILKQMEQGLTPKIRLLGARIETIEMDDAKPMGVPEEWANRVESSDFRQVFLVTMPYAGHDSGFQEGDIILSLDGELVTRASSIFKPELPDSLEAVIVRNSNVMSLDVSTYPTEDVETSRIIIFCGAVLQKPHLGIRQKVTSLYSDVYVAGYSSGSPVERYDIFTRQFITAVNGVSTPELDAFIEEVGKIPDNEYFRLTLMDTQNIQSVKTLKKDDFYFPMVEYQMDKQESCGWKVILH